MTSAHAYVILGAAGSGRHEVLADLLAGLPSSLRLVVCVSERELEKATAAGLGGEATFILKTWKWEDGGIEVELPEGSTGFIFVSEGASNPVDQIEAFYYWSRNQRLDVARILSVVHCRLAYENPDLQKWYDACIHFSDYVLLNRREGVPEKWMKSFQERYRKLFYPCIFEMVKKGRVRNPALVMDPLPRRLSQLFDDDDEEGAEPEEPGEAEGDALEVSLDPYFDRLPSGKRAREIPDIGGYLSGGDKVRE